MTDDPIRCPKCGWSYTHQGEVHVYARKEDEPGKAIKVTPEGGVTSADVSTGFAGRRQDVRIAISCEGCKETSWLYIQQHKGNTYLRWGDEAGNLQNSGPWVTFGWA